MLHDARQTKRTGATGCRENAMYLPQDIFDKAVLFLALAKIDGDEEKAALVRNEIRQTYRRKFGTDDLWLQQVETLSNQVLAMAAGMTVQAHLQRFLNEAIAIRGELDDDMEEPRGLKKGLRRLSILRGHEHPQARPQQSLKNCRQLFAIAQAYESQRKYGIRD